MNTNICTYMYTYLYIYAFTYEYKYIHMYMYIHIYIYICIFLNGQKSCRVEPILTMCAKVSLKHIF